MAASNKKSKIQLSGWRQNGLLAVAYVLIFAGLGGFVVNLSHAESMPCVEQNLVQGNQGRCVKDLQSLLNGMQHTYRDAGYLGATVAVDGNDGASTVAQVQVLQSYVHLPVDGQAGGNTWGRLCFEMRAIPNYAASWQDASCAKDVQAF